MWKTTLLTGATLLGTLTASTNEASAQYIPATCGPVGYPGYGYGYVAPRPVVVAPRPVIVAPPVYGYPHHHHVAPGHVYRGGYGYGGYGHGIHGPASGVGFSNRNFSLWLGR